MRIYLALPITGRDYDSVVEDIKSEKSRLESMGYEVLHPMTGKSYLRTDTALKAEGYKYPTSTNHAIYERDKWMVSRCDIALFNFWYAKDKISIGMLMELAFASILDKHSVAIIQNDNIHNHAFVLEAVDTRFTNPSEAYEYLAKLIKGEI